AEIESLIPHLDGEVGVALISLKPMLENKNAEAAKLPAIVFALKLKSPEPAKLFSAGKLFKGAEMIRGVTALGAPVARVIDKDKSKDKLDFYYTVTENYLVLAESVETLKLLESPEKLAGTRDYQQTVRNAPEKLALMVAYNQSATFEDVRAFLANKSANPGAGQVLSVISAVSHAFHSQRAFMSVNNDVMSGQFAVSFDREGRYSVGELEKDAGDFDVANAIIAPKGLNLYRPTRTELLRLRVKAKQPDVIARVREDLSKFGWNRIESSDQSTLVFSTSARRIPEEQTIKLPVTGKEFAEYLRPTARILSNAPEIVKLAKEIVGEDKDGRSVVRKLGEWTHKNLTWKRVNSDTIDTIASREADCYEHSELFVALARSQGLPARVVTGAAYGDGSFGGHAWVEVYLGKWVEVDPTWGLMEHVDATHLRFADDAFFNYAMLNQLEVEIIEKRSTVAEFQRDPLKLVQSLSDDDSGQARQFAFDLGLTTDAILGNGQLSKLEDKKRDALIRAYERQVAAELDEWASSNASILQSEIKDGKAV
ncbi:MAG TPA: transglutaminase domain-containing protein, partial [Blastocatellia bacterium]|nr:transglutaminase domain-containing protein [Blastocatellia bacterium]